MGKHIDRGQIIKEISKFLEGGNNDKKYVVNVETSYDSNIANCVIHAPTGHTIEEIEFTPFIYIKDLKANNVHLYNDNREDQLFKMRFYGIEFTRAETGNHPRLKNGFCWKVTSTKSSEAIYKFFDEGGLNLREKEKDQDGKVIYDEINGYKQARYKYKDFFFKVSTNEQFFISTGIRLFKGMSKYNEVHKLTFDIETTGLRYEHARVFAIGIKDNKGFERNLFVKKENDDESEKRLIRDFFNTINYIKPAIITGYNSEDFDFDFLFGRANILGLDIENSLPIELIKGKRKLWNKLRRPNTSLKVGGETEKYTSTNMWGYTIIDTHHSVKRAKAINSDIKKTKLKYIAKFAKVAKKNRVYVDGDIIGKKYLENKIHIINPENNKYIELPEQFQTTGGYMYKLIQLKENDKVTDAQYDIGKKQILSADPEFIGFLMEEASKYGKYKFTTGKKIVDQYLLDDIQETEDVDNIYNQASFLLGKIVPTNYHRICTMGSASIWNLLMVTWSFENNLAIPVHDNNPGFSGGLSRCFIKGFEEDVTKIDFASLYPMLQLWLDIFPKFDIMGVIKKMLIYMTTTRNIYKKSANSDDLSTEELDLLYALGDVETYEKYKNGTLTKDDRKEFKIKQAPIKILNNALFGALGSGVAFNWSDSICAARITCSGRLSLRQAIMWFFKRYKFKPLLAVTDGINFKYPRFTTSCFDNNKEWESNKELPIKEAWKYGDKVGLSAVIEKFNEEIMTSEFMSVDNDGEFVSCYNLKRINYALLENSEDDEGNLYHKVKVVGNTIKSSTLPEYIEDFIDKGLLMILEGRGEDFVNFYYDYAEKIFYKEIPLKKIASKSKMKVTIKQYLNRGADKNGKLKSRQAHMELVIRQRVELARELFYKHFDKLDRKDTDKPKEDYSDDELYKLIETYMPPEPELDSTLYYVNTGTRKSHGDVKIVKKKDKEGNLISEEVVINANLINNQDLEENPDMTGEYNVDKYLDALNSRIEGLFDGFVDEVKDKILVKIERKKKDKREQVTLIKQEFTNDQLKLKSFKLDDIDEVMYLENMEIDFWNRTGYNPNVVWDGFKVPENYPLELDIYQNAVEYVRKSMKEKGYVVKTVNDDLVEGDFVLYKDGKKYSLGWYKNGYVTIVKDDVAIPKTEKELEREKKEEETRKKVEDQLKLQNELNKEVELPTYMSLDESTRNSLYSEFVSIIGMGGLNWDMVTMFKNMPEVEKDFAEWVADKYNYDNEYIHEPDNDIYVPD
jgi:DNA polymerase elongation subunit (family B)